MKHLKRNLSLFLAVVLALSLLTLPATAAGQTPATTPAEETSSQDALFAQYVQQVFDTNRTGHPAKFGTTAYQTLPRTEKQLYNTMKQFILRIANGQNASSQMILDLTPYNWSERNYSSHIHNVVDALLLDLPYAFYWYDKVSGFTLEGPVDQLLLSLSVSQDYALNGVSDGFSLDTRKTGAASQAAANAKKVVTQYQNLSDIAKLRAYKDYICSQVDYDYDAFYDEDRPYGDPWQLIHAFDNDPNTNIVCEGYSKAFNYLCDLSTFQSDVTCYIIFGNPDAPHMWNLVDINGRSFLVDVTFCDGGVEKMFLVNTSGMLLDDGSYDESAMAFGNITYGYQVGISSSEGDIPIYYDYIYDKSILDVYGPCGVLDLSETPHTDPQPPIEPVIGHHSPWASQTLNMSLELDLFPARLSNADLTKPIRRDEFASVAVKLYEDMANTWVPDPLYNLNPNPFKDTNDPDVLKAFTLGIVNGVSPDRFAPASLLTREQASTMLTRAYKAAAFPDWTLETDADFPLDFPMPARFRDDKNISRWARDSVYFMASCNVLNGIGNNTFAPRHNASR